MAAVAGQQTAAAEIKGISDHMIISAGTRQGMTGAGEGQDKLSKY